MALNDEIKLGPRLKTIASFVPEGTLLGDIGTDHAYLPVYLIQKEAITRAVGVDIHQGPYQAARATVKSYGLENRIDIRLGDGLLPLRRGEVETLVIAGMGGKTILEILKSNPPVMEEIKTLILQPQGYEGKVRRQLLMQGWKLQEECLVTEDRLFYCIVCFSRSEGFSLTDLELMIRPIEDSIAGLHGSKLIWQLGPLLLLRKEKLLIDIINNTIHQRLKIINEMKKAARNEVRQAISDVQAELNILEGIKKWLLQ